MKIDRKVLLKQMLEMGYDLDAAKEELVDLVEWYLSLPKKMILYRVIQVDELSSINKERPGSHYSKYKVILQFTLVGFVTHVGVIHLTVKTSPSTTFIDKPVVKS